jgi:S-DNA-T family DNA segregation ATPase FtsK/SpoIIIE
MVLGRSARLHGAECDLIPASLPGIGYVIQEGVREPVRVRAGYVSDDDLGQMVHDYAPRTAPEPQTTSEPALQLVAEP